MTRVLLAELDSNPRRVRKSIRSAARALCDAGLSRSLTENVELAVTEAVNNVIEHGYGGRSGGIILIEYEMIADTLKLTILDQSQGMADTHLPSGRLPDLMVEKSDLPEGGYGWFIIRSLTRRQHYSRHEGWNRLSLTFDL